MRWYYQLVFVSWAKEFFFFFNCQHCEFVWGFLLCLSIRQYYKPFLQDDRHKHILPFYPLKNCWHLWKQYCPTLRHFPVTWRHYLTVQHQPYNSTLNYWWAFPLSSKVCTPAQSSVAKGWSNPTPFQTWVLQDWKLPHGLPVT